jgi:dTDP-4-dehydrorhamnose 3,5-epimerase
VEIVPTDLPGVLLLQPKLFPDERGFFYESFNAERFAAAGLPSSFPQDNHSRSGYGVLRGLHYQLDRPQGKLITCVRGSVFDVAVDIRIGSPTFGRWTAVSLTEEVPRYFWVPAGFAHGFCATSEIADVIYKCTDVYASNDQRGVIWSDPDLRIEWPIQRPQTSLKDEQYAPLAAPRDDLPRYVAD